MVKLTPNSIKRPSGTSIRLEESSTGLYVVRDAYEGRYEFFKNRPLRAKRPAIVLDAPARGHEDK